MEANIVDLRYKMKDVLKAIERNEPIDVLYRGVKKAVIVPVTQSRKKSAKEYALFNSQKETPLSVSEQMNQLRTNRYDNI